MEGTSTEGITNLWSTEGSLDDVSTSNGFNLEILNTLAGCVGVAGNGFALLVLVGYRRVRRRVWSSLLVNQCVLDLVASLITVCYHVGNMVIGDDFKAPYLGLAGTLYCKLWASALWHWSLMIGSSYNLLAISLERYLMVIHPVFHKNHVSRQRVNIVAVCPWIIGVIAQCSYGIPTSELQGRTCVTYAVWPNTDAMRISGVISTVVPFFLPAAIMIALYTKVVAATRARVRPGEHQQQSSTSANVSKSQRNLTKTCLIVVLAFVACWSPSQCFWLLYNLGVDLEMRDDFHFVSLLLVYLNCSVNPFIYIFSYMEFQQGMRNLFGCQKLGASRVGVAVTGPGTSGTGSRISRSKTASSDV